MRILLANKFYYPRGGDCIYTLNVEDLLRRHGHEVAVFFMQHPENLPSPWSAFSPSEIKFSAGRGAFTTLQRILGHGEVIQRFNALLDTFHPDILHLNNIHTQLSPVIARLAHQRGIRVVWTLHDYKLLCPRYDCLRNGKMICETCFTHKTGVLKYRCMKNSLAASLLAYWEAVRWDRKQLEATTDHFICPSQFMASKMLQGGFDPNKITALCNFIDTAKCRNAPTQKEDYYCMVGRLSHEKGGLTLLKAAADLPYTLIIAGNGPLMDKAKSMASGQVEFVGHQPWSEIRKIIGRARFSVIPSEWYENNPLTLIESHCLGTPALGARIGGIPEMIMEGMNGMTFESGNATSLKAKIEEMFTATFDYPLLAEIAQQRYDANLYYAKLMSIYSTTSASVV